MARYRKLIIALLTPILTWAVALGWVPEAAATPETVASFATAVAALVGIVGNRDQ